VRRGWRDVAAAADNQLAARHRQHRRRRLRRDARNLAIDEIVEHQVADAEHRRLIEPRELLIDIVHRWLPIPDPSTVAIRTIEEQGDVASDGLFERREGVL